jgi:hypothetical protein
MRIGVISSFEFLAISTQRHAATPAILVHTLHYASEAASLENEGQDKTRFRESFMMITNRVRLVWMFCLVAAAASVQAQIEPHQKFVCSSGPVKRVVTIFHGNGQRESGGCRVDYTKDGETKTVWTSRNDYAYCVAKAVSLVTKLTEGNFSCKPETADQPDEIQPAQQAPAPESQPER